MKIGILADAHGNIDALQICISLLKQQKTHKIIYLGDAIGYFPYSEQVCNLLNSIDLTYIEGNHEAIFSKTINIDDNKKPIIAHPQGNSPALQQWTKRCAGVGPIREITFDHRKFLLVHGSPDDPYSGRIEQTENVPSDGYDILLTAHTHRPLLGRTRTGKLVLNPGSCGYPRDNGSLLSLGILETQTLQAEIIRIPFKYTQQIFSEVHPAVRNVLQRSSDFIGTIRE